jgi:hypothetical protein
MPFKDKEKQKEYNKNYFKENKNKLLKYQKNYREVHKEEISKKKKIYTAIHTEHKKEYDKKYQKINKESIREKRSKYTLLKYHTDTKFKILHNLRRRLLKVLKQNKKFNHTINLIGCSLEELKNHLELQFKVGMNWGNYGHGGWEIDHIKPCSNFDLSKESEQKKCFHYTNLQPLWAEENNKKRNIYEGVAF